jgi:Lrp/AsnC family leucine-responsive transcriptional regulator
MAAEFAMDDIDWKILSILQEDARRGYTDIAGQISMSASAVTERVRRMERAGVICGYSARVDPAAVGLVITALVRLKYPHGNYQPFHDFVAVTDQIVEAHHVTGEDCFVLKVLARSMVDLETVVGRIAGLGSVTTSVVYSSPLPNRSIPRISAG